MRKKHKLAKRLLTGVLSLALVFSSTNMPGFGITVRAAESEKTLICDQTEHTHGEDCYTVGDLICGQEETEEHTHSEDCYGDPQLTCGLEEHTHTEECYSVNVETETTEIQNESAEESEEESVSGNETTEETTESETLKAFVDFMTAFVDKAKECGWSTDLSDEEKQTWKESIENLAEEHPEQYEKFLALSDIAFTSYDNLTDEDMEAVESETEYTTLLAEATEIMQVLSSEVQTTAVDGSTVFGTKKPGTYSDYYKLTSKTYELTADTNISGYLDIPSGVTVTINLNGYTLRRTDTINNPKSSGGVICINGGTLTINSNGGSGTITGGNNTKTEHDASGGISIVGGELTAYNTTIKDCKGSCGAAVCDIRDTTQNIKLVNCYITGCSSTYASGAINLTTSGTTVTLKDCTITGNHDTDVGGAIDNCGKLILKGKTRIYGNTSTSSNLADDITMGGGGTIDASELTEGSYIGLVYSSNEDRNNLDAKGGVVVNTGINTTRAAYFFSNDSRFGKQIIGSSLKLVPHTHSWSYAATDNVITATCAENNPSGVSCGVGKTQTLTLDASACSKTWNGSVCTTPTITPSENWTATKQSATPAIYYEGVSPTTYTKSTTKPTAAGTYKASITVGGKTATAEFTIAKAGISVTEPTQKTGITYNGTAQQLVSAGSVAGNLGTVYYKVVKQTTSRAADGTWSTSVPTATDAGTYTISYYAAPNDTNHNGQGSQSAPIDTITVTIAPKTLTPEMVTLGGNKNWTGNEQTQSLTIADGSALTSSDYETTGDALAQTEVGTYSVTVTGQNNYTGTVTKEWKILGNDFLSSDYSVEGYSDEYDADEHSITVTQNNNTITEFKVLYATEQNGTYSERLPKFKDASANAYTVWYKVKAKGYNESAPASATVTITKKDLTITPNAGQSKVYGDTESALKYTAPDLIGDDTLSGTLDRAAGETKGTYAYNLGTLANSNYNISLATDASTFEIKARPVTLTWTKSDLTYNSVEQSVTATVSNKVGNDNINLTYSNNEKTEVGNYTAEVKELGNPNYTLEGATGVENNWSISYLVVADAVVSGDKKIEDSGWYTGVVSITPVDRSFTISADGKTDWTDELATSQNGSNTVTYYLKDANGFITDKKSATFKIDTTVPEGTITIGSNTFKEFLNEITFGYFFKDTVDVNITANDPKADGVDEVSGIKSVEYQKVNKGETYHADGTWTKGNSLSVTADEKFVVYAKITDKAGNVTVVNSDGVVVYTDATSRDSVTFTKTGTADVTTNIAVGVNTIKSVTLTKKETDAEAKPILNSGYEVVDGKVVLKASFLNTLLAGEYQITVSYNPYGETFVHGEDANDSVITLIVQKAEGQVSNISDVSKIYDKNVVTEPTFDKKGTGTATIEYKVKDAEDSTYTEDKPKNAGSYTVRVTVASDDNYAEASVTKDFTISKADASITTAESSYTKIYGDAEFTIEGVEKVGESTVTYTSNDTSIVTVDSTGKVSIKGAGETTITLAMAGSDNYNATTKTVNVRVNPKAITVTADNNFKIYDDADPTLTYSVNAGGLVEKDTLSQISVVRDDGEDVDTYVITASQPKDANKNYKITFNPGTFTINPRSVTVDADSIEITGDGSFVYDETAKEPVVNVKDDKGNVIPASEYTVTYANNTDASVDTTDSSLKPVVIITDKEGGNYTVNGFKRFEIAKAETVLSVSSVGDKTYGEKEFQLVVTKTGESTPTFTSSNTSVATVDENGKITIKGAGTAKIIVAMAASKNYKAKEVEVTFEVRKAGSSILAPSTTVTKTYGDADFTLDVSGVGGNRPTFTSSNEKVATVDKDGKVSIKGAGTVKITVEILSSSNYSGTSKEITVNIARKDIKGAVVTLGEELKSNDTVQTQEVKSVVLDGKEVTYTVTGNTAKDPGNYVMTIKGTGNYTGTVEVPFTVVQGIVHVESVKLNKTTLTLERAGDSESLKVNIAPSNTTNKKVTWKSSNTKVVKIDANGKVTAVGAGTVTITVTTADGAKKVTCKVTVQSNASDLKVAKFGRLKARAKDEKKTSMTIAWINVPEADGYLIYGNLCDTKIQKYAYQFVKDVPAGTTSMTRTKLASGTYYKHYVVAYKKVGGKKKRIAVSVPIHATTAGGDSSVAQAVKVTKISKRTSVTKVTLAKGASVEASAVEVKGAKPIAFHRALRYECGNTKVATVSNDGKITAVAKGKAWVWVYAQNGVYKSIEVTVK